MTYDLIRKVRTCRCKQFCSELPDEIVFTLELIGKKWIMPILYVLQGKRLGFSDLKRQIGINKISSNMLSLTLDKLQQHNGLFQKFWPSETA